VFVHGLLAARLETRARISDFDHRKRIVARSMADEDNALARPRSGTIMTPHERNGEQSRQK